MIDYDKLKIAHNLAERDSLLGGNTVNLAVRFMNGKHSYWLFDSSVDHEYDDIDDLILKLKELVKSNPRYEIGQSVWCLHRDEVINFTIEKVENFGDEIWYSFRNSEHEVNRFIESILYPSREYLIDAQIEYWSSLKKEEISTCSDDVSMESEDRPILAHNDCPKCGAKINDVAGKLDNGDWRISCSGCDYFSDSTPIKDFGSFTDGGSECEHEGDERSYSQKIRDYVDIIERKLCRKCGDYYR